MNTNRLVLTTAVRRRSLEEDKRNDCDEATKAVIVTFTSLASMRRRCRMLNDAYEAAENKPEVRMSIQQTVRRLRELHAMLPSRLQRKSWISTIEYYDSWSLEAKKSA